MLAEQRGRAMRLTCLMLEFHWQRNLSKMTNRRMLRFDNQPARCHLRMCERVSQFLNG